MTLIAIVNCGSSSIKYRALDPDTRQTVVDGLVEGIGEATGKLRLRFPNQDRAEITRTEPIADHRSGLAALFREVDASRALEGHGGLACIGHRVVHGGEEFTQPALITEDVLDAIRRQIPLAPLHNPANIAGIEAAMVTAPHTPQVAVFDTAFHQTMPPHAYRYPVPNALYEEHRVRRYGFHGTSHGYVSRAAAEFIGMAPEAFNGVILHLGNGASATAVRGGQSVDTSMGLTPLEGLMMGTRSGDVDPALHHFLSDNAGLSIDEIDRMLNRESGEAGDEAARLAFDMYCYRIRKYLGAYMAVLGRVDAVVFTAGVGENSPLLRAAVCEGLEPLGITLDPARNEGRGGPKAIHAEGSQTQVLVIPTAEELEIAMQAQQCIAQANT